MPPVKCAFCDVEHPEGTRFCPKTGKALAAPPPANRTMVMFRAEVPLPGASPAPASPPPPRRRTLTPSAPLTEVPPPPVAADRVPRPPVEPGLENSGVVRTPVTGEHSSVGSGSRASGLRNTASGSHSASGSRSTGTGSGPQRAKSLPSWVAAPEAGGTERLPTTMFPAVDAAPRPALALVKDALTIYQQHAQALLLTAAVLFVPGSLLGALLRLGTGLSPRLWLAALLIEALLMALVAGLVAPLTNGALTLAAADRLLGGGGKPLEYWRWLLSRWRPLLSSVLPAAGLCFLGTVLFVLPGLVLSFVFLFVPLVVLFENESGISALKRSFMLVKADWLRTGALCGLFLLATLIPGVLVSQLPSPLLRAGLGILLSLALIPLAALTVLFLYLDNRRTTEGFDKESLRTQLDALRGRVTISSD